MVSTWGTTELTIRLDRFPLTTAARTAKSGLLFGIAYGGIQDLLGLARGRPIGYVESIKRRIGGGGSASDLGDDRRAVAP